MSRLVAGCDVGGTFTDAVAVDAQTGRRARAKVPTTPTGLEEGVAEALLEALGALSVDPGRVDAVLHGTTVATNALLEDALAPVALVTNEGFRDVLEIGRQTRSSLYDLDDTGPPPMVPREHRYEVPGRLDADGTEIEPVDEDAARRVAGELAAAPVEAVAVCLLHAHVDPSHERIVADALRDHADGLRVVTSHGTSPEIREVERFTTTVANAGLVPLMVDYLDRLTARLAEEGIEAPVRVMDSQGGLLPPPEAARLPVRLALSGPAGGVAALRRLSSTLDEGDLIGVDMGGTSTDVSLILDGEPTTRWQTTVAGRRLQIPAADVHTVGAGGGSIAWVDEAGGLRVGPRSQGAEPGPAAYGKGGSKPTVTDANVTLNRIPDGTLLGGEISVVGVSAKDAIRPVAEKAGLGLEEAAASIVKVATAKTVRGMRRTVARHGADPAKLTVVAFGGAGPQFGADWATLLGASRVLVPRGAGVTSAEGLLAAPPRIERSRSLVKALPDLATGQLEAVLDALEDDAVDALGDDPARVHRLASARYEGQSHELTVPAEPARPDAIREAFQAAHEHHHGYALEDARVEVVTLRARASSSPVLDQAREPEAKPGGTPPWEDTVQAWHAGPEARIPTRQAPASVLEPGHRFTGPALVTGPDSTLVVPPAWSARVLGAGHVLLERRRRP